MKTPKCFELVKCYILNSEYEQVTAENTAQHLGVKVGDVTQCFHILNLQGILSQARRPFIVNKGEWEPNHYNVLRKKDEPSRWDPDNESPDETLQTI